MNIIQLQDRLKGVPDQALVGYVENPTGEVPTYLALSELQRRKDMRERYQADQTPQATVADQLVEESKPKPMPMQMPAGIDQLPAPNIGQNYAGGGIVSFAAGDLVPVPGTYKTSRVDRVGARAGLPAVIPGGPVVPVAGEAAAAVPWYKRIIPGALGLAKRHPYIAGGSALYGLYSLFSDDEEETPQMPMPDPNMPMLEQEDYDTSVARPNIQTIPVEEIDPREYVKERTDLYREILGTDPNQARLQEKLDKMESKTTAREERAPWMALTEAGLAMAAGQSPDAITNIAQGATQGIKSYSEAVDDINAAREKELAIDMELAKAKRAEEVAIATKGIESLEAKEARNDAYKLQNMKEQNAAEIAYANIQADIKKAEMIYNTKGVLKDEDILESYNELKMMGQIPEGYSISDYKQYLMQQMGRLKGGRGSGAGSIVIPEGVTVTPSGS